MPWDVKNIKKLPHIWYTCLLSTYGQRIKHQRLRRQLQTGHNDCQTTSNLIQFRFTIKISLRLQLLMTNKVMNLQFFRQSKLLANLNKSLADELNQPTSFPTAHSNKKVQKTK